MVEGFVHGTKTRTSEALAQQQHIVAEALTEWLRKLKAK